MTPSPRGDGSEMVVEVGSVPKTGQKNAYPRDNLYPTARSLPVCAGAHASLSLPLSAAIDLREIHLAPQSSLQVPVGHIPCGLLLWRPVELALLPEFAFNVEQVVPAE